MTLKGELVVGFALGKYYRHVKDIRIHVCGICDTEAAGRCLVAEDHEGHMFALDENDESAAFYSEICREEFIDGVKRAIESGESTTTKKKNWMENPVSEAQLRFIRRIYKVLKGVPRFTGHTKQDANEYIQKWTDAYHIECAQQKALKKSHEKQETEG